MFFTRDTEGRLAHLSGAGKKCRHRQLLLGLLAMIKSRASTHSCSSRCCIPVFGFLVILGVAARRALLTADGPCFFSLDGLCECLFDGLC
jgi:hypothetical protein